MSISYCALRIQGNLIVQEKPVGGVQIAGSVGALGTNGNNDVKVVQQLLNFAMPALGMTIKKLAVDGLVGPKTIEAISRFQSMQLGFSDGRVDPGGRTLARLNILTGGLSGGEIPVLARSSITATASAPRQTPLAAAIAATPLALVWTLAAIAHLNGLIIELNLFNNVANPVMFSVANAHFHLDRDLPNVRTDILKLLTVFNRIRQMLSAPATFYREGASTPTSKFADAPMGGFDLAEPHHHITIRSEYPDCGLKCRAAMLVHEGAHFCGTLNEINHFAHEFPIPNGAPQGAGHTRNYRDLLTSEAMKNASSYAAFAIHAATGLDSRFGLDKKNQ